VRARLLWLHSDRHSITKKLAENDANGRWIYVDLVRVSSETHDVGGCCNVLTRLVGRRLTDHRDANTRSVPNVVMKCVPLRQRLEN